MFSYIEKILSDFVPKSGVALPEKHLKDFAITKLKPSDSPNAALVLKHPYNRHFYRFQLGKDFIVKDIPFKAEKRNRIHFI